MSEPATKTAEEHFTVELTTNLIDELETFVNSLGVHTRRPDKYPFDTVAGEVLSKCFTICRCVMFLINGGFADEAFGLCRTLYECSIYLRYITLDPEKRDQRAHEFMKFGVTSKGFWLDLLTKRDLTDAELAEIEQYKAENAIPDDPKIVSQPWSGIWRFIEKFSKEAHPVDSVAWTEQFRLGDKAISYTDTSSYVHATQPGLNNHVFDFREVIQITCTPRGAANNARKACMVIQVHLRTVLRYCLFGWGLATADELRDRRHPAADIFSDGTDTAQHAEADPENS